MMRLSFLLCVICVWLSTTRRSSSAARNKQQQRQRRRTPTPFNFGILEIQEFRKTNRKYIRMVKSKIPFRRPKEIKKWRSVRKKMEGDLKPLLSHKATTVPCSLLRRLGWSGLLTAALWFLNQDDYEITEVTKWAFGSGIFFCLWAHTIWSVNDRILRKELQIPT